MVLSETESYEFRGFRIDVEGRVLLRAGEELALTPRAFDVLTALVRRAGEVVRKQELLDTVWSDAHVEESVLTQNVYTLRKLLDDRGPTHRMIATVPRIGYRFIAPVRDASPESDGRVQSLAVLPFEALGDDEELRVVGVGLADALTTRLSAVRHLTVRPTSAVLALDDDSRALAVDAVLEGRLQSAGGRVRATVQLVATTTRETLWGDTVDEVAGDLFAVQDAISARLSEALRLELAPSELDAGTRSGEAYQAYLKGRYFWNQRTAASLNKAIEQFDTATRLDPRWALPRVGLADCQVLLPFYADGVARESFPAAREHATRALELEPRLAEAETVLGYIEFVYDRDPIGAERRLRRALDLKPDYATAHQRYAFLLAALGRFEGAVIHASRAVELDPLSLVNNADLAWVHYFARQYDDAVAQFEATLELDPHFGYARVGLALALVQKQQLEAATLQARRAVEDSGGGSVALATLAHVLGRAGEPDEARSLLSDELPASRHALARTGLGDLDAAIEALERACDERSRFVVFLNVWPAYDALRARPGFRRVLERVGLRSLA